eukprot:7149843-Pyramimonas_sp.AAC.2
MHPTLHADALVSTQVLLPADPCFTLDTQIEDTGYTHRGECSSSDIIVYAVPTTPITGDVPSSKATALRVYH